MREYTKKPESQSRTLDSNPKAFKQAPIDVIIQRYKERNIQRYAEDEELIQGKFSDTVQREEFDEDELLQGKFDTVQREGIDEDELLQGKFETSIVQREEIDIPDNLKNGIEAPSGYSMDDVRVHYNSPKAAQLQALAYAQGTDIHVAPEQKQHLPHEACYVVQQKQGRVQPTMQLQGVNVNDNGGLEKEADVMGGKAVEKVNTSKVFGYKFLNSNLIQRKIIVDGTVYPYGGNSKELNYSKREFRKLLMLSLQCFKYKETGTRAMWNRINTWLADEDDSEERTFKDWEELTSKLWDDNLLTRVMSGPSMGPKNLGNRPSFTSDVIKQFPVGLGQHRRHIISSSTLGKAIEKGYEYLKSKYTDNKNQVLITLNEWLTRNHETVKTTEYSALRAIWTHVHNHSGNIWVGDGKWNSAIGLIRSSLTSLLSRLRRVPVCL